MSDAILTTRAALGITYCSTCGCDTIPDARTGDCFWCSTHLTDPDARYATVVRSEVTRDCAYCHEPFTVTVANRKYCSTRCKDSAWRASDRGSSYHDERNARRREARAEYVAELIA